MVIPLALIVRHELARDPAEKALTQRNHPIEAFFFDRSDNASSRLADDCRLLWTHGPTGAADCWKSKLPKLHDHKRGFDQVHDTQGSGISADRNCTAPKTSRCFLNP